MKKLKYVKLFESFLNEELSPELKKRAYDAMMKIAADPSALDNQIKKGQAKNISSMLSAPVKKCIEKINSILKEYGKRIYNKSSNQNNLEIHVYNDAMTEGVAVLHVGCKMSWGGLNSIFKVIVSKDKYERMQGFFKSSAPEGQENYEMDVKTYDLLCKDRAFINAMKELIVEFQKNEIPGELEVPMAPESLTPQGSLDVINTYGTGGGDGLPPVNTEAGQMARGN